MIKKKGLKSFNPFGRTLITLKQNVKLFIKSHTSENIYFPIFVISFITKLQYIGFCHAKSENFGNNKFFPMYLYPPQKLMLTKVIQPDKNRYGILEKC